MCFLRVLRFRLIDVGLCWQVLFAIALCNKFTNLDNSFVRQRNRVRTHIGYETNRPFSSVHAFIQFLCRHHGAPRIEAQFSGGFLLQRRSREWRCWITATLFLINDFDSQLAFSSSNHGVAYAECRSFTFKTKLLYFVAFVFNQS